MSGPVTPHVITENHADGIRLGVKGIAIVLPPDMARTIGQALIALADAHDPLAITPLPTVAPAGQPIT